MLGLKSYAYLGAGLALLGVLYASYDYGRKTERDKAQQAVNEFRSREALLLTQIEEAKKQTKVVTRERIKIVKEAVGVCLDERIPNPLLDSLQHDVPSG